MSGDRQEWAGKFERVANASNAAWDSFDLWAEFGEDRKYHLDRLLAGVWMLSGDETPVYVSSELNEVEDADADQCTYVVACLFSRTLVIAERSPGQHYPMVRAIRRSSIEEIVVEKASPKFITEGGTGLQFSATCRYPDFEFVLPAKSSRTASYSKAFEALVSIAADLEKI